MSKILGLLLFCLCLVGTFGKTNYAEVRAKVAQASGCFAVIVCAIRFCCCCAACQAYAEKANEMSDAVAVLTALSKESVGLLEKIDAHCT